MFYVFSYFSFCFFIFPFLKGASFFIIFTFHAWRGEGKACELREREASIFDLQKIINILSKFTRSFRLFFFFDIYFIYLFIFTNSYFVLPLRIWSEKVCEMHGVASVCVIVCECVSECVCV